MLNGMIIPNDSYVLASDIAVYYNGLLCHTDKSGCCRASNHPNGTNVAQGQWYYPDGREVMSYTVVYYNTSSPRNFFFRNRGTGRVRLNIQGNPSERGRFRCEIPSAAGGIVILYVNIGPSEWFVLSCMTIILFCCEVPDVYTCRVCASINHGCIQQYNVNYSDNIVAFACSLYCVHPLCCWYSNCWPDLLIELLSRAH